MPNLPVNRLTILPVADEDCKMPLGPPFVCLINPSSLTLEHKIVYNTSDDAQGNAVENKSFKNTPSPELSFDIIIDGTGVIDQLGVPVDVIAQVEAFKKACFYYYGTIHCPPKVLITWWAPLLKFQEQTFAGVIDNFSLTYTLFSPNGRPLRAKIRTKFVGSMDKKAQNAATKKSSPDLTHIKTINEGTSLSVLCKEIYGDESFILEVARLNNLVSFRNIKPGSKLIFPPIK
jgi:hypothetical protein